MKQQSNFTKALIGKYMDHFKDKSKIFKLWNGCICQ